MPSKPKVSHTAEPMTEVRKQQAYIDSLEETLDTQQAQVKETKAQIESARVELRQLIVGRLQQPLPFSVTVAEAPRAADGRAQ